MVRFCFLFILTAALLSFAVWRGLPRLRESDFASYSKIAKTLGVEVAPPQAAGTGAALPAGAAPREFLEEKDAFAEEDGRAPEFRTAKDELKENALTAVKPAETRTVGVSAAEFPPAAAEPVVSDPGLPWGIVVTNSAFYVFEGGGLRRAGVVKGGTVFEYASEKTLNEGKCYSCKFLRKKEWTEKFFVVLDSDVVIFPDVTYSEADPEQRGMLIEFCSLYGKYEGLRLAEYERLASKYVNPYEKDYLHEKEKYDEFQAEVGKMKALERRTQFENVPGVSRGKLLADLRRMSVRQKEIEKIFFPVRDKYNAWEASHERREITVENTPEMLELLERMRGMKDRVNAIVPGLMPANL